MPGLSPSCPIALSRVADVRNPFYRAHLIEAFAPRLPAELVPRALSITAAIVNSGARARTIAAIASGSTTTVDESILVSAVDSLAAVADEASPSDAMTTGRLVSTCAGGARPVGAARARGDRRRIHSRRRFSRPPSAHRRAVDRGGSRTPCGGCATTIIAPCAYAELSGGADPHDGSRLIGTAVATVDAIRDTRARAEAWREIVRRMESQPTSSSWNAR